MLGTLKAQDSILIKIDDVVVVNANTIGTNGWLEGTGATSVCQHTPLTLVVEFSSPVTMITWQSNRSLIFRPNTHNATVTLDSILVTTDITVQIQTATGYAGWAKLTVTVIPMLGSETITTDGDEVILLNDTLRGTFCPIATGIQAILSNSNQNYFYQFWDRNSGLVLEELQGNGGTIPFSRQIEGTYGIIKWDPTRTCFKNL